MKAYKFLDDGRDPREPHEGEEVALEVLSDLKVLTFHFEDIARVVKLAQQRKYHRQDQVTLCPKKMGQSEYDRLMKIFYEEHLHDDEEIRYIIEGRAYFDIRDKSDQWIRVAADKGDMIVLPPGIYHRFTTASDNYLKAMRLFKASPEWKAFQRSVGNRLDCRTMYLESIFY